MNPTISSCRALKTTWTLFVAAVSPFAVRSLATDIVTAAAAGVHRISAMRCPILTRLVCAAVMLCSMSAWASVEKPHTAERVTLQLKWTHAFQFAGYYAALEKGYYQEAGLDVNILEAMPGVDPIKSVLEGQAQFGVGTSSLLLQRTAGKPVVALAVIFQHSPYVLIARHDNATQGIHDLVGKRIMLEPQSEEVLAYLKAEGIPLERLTRVEHSYDPQDLIAGRVDAIAGYVTNQPYYLDRAGFPYQIYTPRSAGIDFYGDNLFTTEQELRDHPARVKAFRAASLRGWQYAMDHPEEIVDLIVAKYSQRHTRDYFLFEARKMVPLLRPDLVEVGYMYPGRWRHIADVYADLGMMKPGFALEGFLYDANPSPPDLRWLSALIGVATLVIGIISTLAAYIYRTNARLRKEVAEHKQSQEALRDAEWKFHALFEKGPIGVAYHEMIYDASGDPIDYRFVDANESFRELTGVDPRGKTVLQVFPGIEKDSFDWIGTYGHVARTGEPIRFEQRLRPNGRWYDCFAYQYKPDHFVAAFMETTERRWTEDALRDSEARYQSILSASPDDITITDLELRILMISPAALRVFGYTRDQEMLGHLITDFLVPEDRSRAVSNIAMMFHGAMKGPGEYRALRADGSIFDEEANAEFIRGTDGHPTGLVFVIRDITERKRAEAYREMGQEVLQILNQPAELQDSIQRILTAFKAWTGVDAVGIRLQDGDDFPYFSQQGLSKKFLLTENTLIHRDADGGVCRNKDGKVCLECTCGLVISGNADPGHPLFTRGGSFWTNDSFPLLDLPADQDPRNHPRNQCIHHGYASVALVPIRNEDRIVGLIHFNDRRKGCFTLETVKLLEGIASHIGAALMRKQAEVALRVAKEAAEAATQVKEQFLAKLSHELRTPLTPVLLMTSQWQAQADIPASLRDDLAMVRRNLELEARLLDDLLDANRILYGKLSLRREVVGVHQAIGESMEIVAAAAQAKRLRLTVQLQATNDRIDGDPARVQQILWNLLSNAIKFTPEAGSIAVATANAPDGQIRVQVTDNGMGIDADLLSRLFGAFEQGGQQINHQYGGMGLGLSICKSMVEAHGGSITAASEGRGKGATFTVQFPVTHAAVAVEPAVLTPMHATPAGIGPLRILLVEDNADTARIMSRLLRAKGYAVETAGDVASALDCMNGAHFDLLVSDLGLPDGTGHDLMRQLVAAGQLIKAIAVSGYGTEDDIRKSLEAGFVEHLVKPINLPQLLATIQRVIGTRTAGVTEKWESTVTG